MASIAAVRNVTRGTLVADRVVLGGSLWDRFRGLMGRPSLAPGEGLWLPGVNSIHMLFMRFPIDAVFVSRRAADGTCTVVAVRHALRPWSGVVWWVSGGHGVLELPAGAAGASRTSHGDRLAFESLPD